MNATGRSRKPGRSSTSRLRRPRAPRLGFLSLLAAAALAATTLGALAPGAAATPPAGFSDTVVATITLPVGLGFAPDGRMLVTTKPGKLYAVSPSGAQTLALDASGFTCAGAPGQDERGMLGVAADPAFAGNGFIYVYYSASKSGTCVNRVSRFTLDGSSHVVAGSEKILIDGILGDGFHNGGDLVFGKDGDLYVSVGDGHCLEGCDPSNQAAQDLKNLNGKILRITPSGGIPSGNPYSGTGTARCNTGPINSGKCQEIYAYGFRNPFRIALDPNASGTRVFVNDVGQNTTEEVDLLKAGGNFGWPKCEGPCNTSGLVDPYFSYPDNQGGGRAAITGGAFVPDNAWNTAYNGKYLFSDYVKNNLYSITATGSSGTNFATFSGGATAITMRFGPQNRGGTGTQQALYYTNLVAGTVHMITSGTSVPTASFTTRPGGAVSYCSTHATTAGAPPLAVSFDGSASSDPKGAALTYHWDFGDGATQTTTTPTSSHTYTAVGSFTPKLTVSSTGGTSPAASGTVRTDDAPPTVAITAPTPSTTFTVGQTYTPAGTATDSQGATLAASALTWQVWLFHINHVHPVLDPVAGNGTTSFVAPPAEQFSAIKGNSRLLVCLSATDSAGVTQTIEQDFNPTLVHLTMATQPAGLKVHIDEDDVDAGGNVTAPATVTSWAGYQIHLTAANQTDSGGHQENFASWSDGGAQAHAVSPTSDTTYAATFTQVTSAIANGGFETGDFTGWTRAGTTSIVSSPVHSGTHAVRLGSTSPTNGDSKVSQTFTAPTGASRVSFFYDENCPDAVQYDWATATLKDNTSGTTTTVLGKTCTLNTGWKQITAAVAPGHSYTLTLVSHDENNPGDATYTVYDDVATG